MPFSHALPHHLVALAVGAPGLFGAAAWLWWRLRGLAVGITLGPSRLTLFAGQSLVIGAACSVLGVALLAFAALEFGSMLVTLEVLGVIPHPGRVL